MKTQYCPLCSQVAELWLETTVQFFYCQVCSLVSKGVHYWPSADEEYTRYQQHNNNSEDARYVQFLCTLLDPLCSFIPQRATGLDFGSGPSRTIAAILKQRGYTAFSYDKYFFPEESLLETTYDFVTASEVFEHLQQPLYELQRIKNILRPGGYLGVMTVRYPTIKCFADWYYWKDPTHVCFYSEATFAWIAKVFAWELVLLAERTCFFRCNNGISY